MRLEWVVALVAIATGGCLKDPASSLGASIDPASLSLNQFEQSSMLTVGGRSIPVQVKVTRQVDLITLQLISRDSEFEREVYKVVADKFCLVQGGGTTFEPPLPLLRFPLRLGDGWEWQGVMAAGDNSNKARAQIITLREPIFVPPIDSLRVRVSLAIDPHKAPNRELSFWFAEDRGLVQRKFGASLRGPGE